MFPPSGRNECTLPLAAVCRLHRCLQLLRCVETILSAFTGREEVLFEGGQGSERDEGVKDATEADEVRRSTEALPPKTDRASFKAMQPI